MIINLNKKYQTRDGRRVELHKIKRRNSCNEEVTYPVKGTIFELVNVRYRKINSVWTMEGKSQAVLELQSASNYASDLVAIE